MKTVKVKTHSRTKGSVVKAHIRVKKDASNKMGAGKQISAVKAKVPKAPKPAKAVASPKPVKAPASPNTSAAPAPVVHKSPIHARMAFLRSLRGKKK